MCLSNFWQVIHDKLQLFPQVEVSSDSVCISTLHTKLVTFWGFVVNFAGLIRVTAGDICAKLQSILPDSDSAQLLFVC